MYKHFEFLDRFVWIIIAVLMLVFGLISTLVIVGVMIPGWFTSVLAEWAGGDGVWKGVMKRAKNKSF